MFCKMQTNVWLVIDVAFPIIVLIKVTVGLIVTRVHEIGVFWFCDASSIPR